MQHFAVRTRILKKSRTRTKDRPRWNNPAVVHVSTRLGWVQDVHPLRAWRRSLLVARGEADSCQAPGDALTRRFHSQAAEGDTASRGWLAHCLCRRQSGKRETVWCLSAALPWLSKPSIRFEVMRRAKSMSVHPWTICGATSSSSLTLT
jgi:hypothetical protein